MTSLPKRNRKLDGGGGLTSATFFHLEKVVAMKNLEIDIETYSSTNLQKSGVYRYVEADDFEVMLFGYAVDGDEVKVIDLMNGEKIPK